MMREISAAEAFCSGTTSTAASPSWSMRWMIRMSRFTLEARSGEDQQVGGGGGPPCARLCGIRGLSTCTSCAAGTLFTATTCVTNSSDVELIPIGQVVARQLPGIGVRNDLDQVAGGDGDEAVDLQDREERLIEGVRATWAPRRASSPARARAGRW